MVFWSGFIKKIKSSVSQLTFDKLKNRVDNIESDYATKTYTDRQDAMLAQNITTNRNEITQLRNEFDSKQYVNYRGNWNSTINYQTGDAITDNDLWYVSNVDNNLNHRPSGHSDTYWELISEPSIDLSNYYTKSQSDSLFAYKGDISNLQGQINDANTSITNLDNTMTNSFRQLDIQINTVRDTVNRTQADLSNNYYNKTTSDNRYSIKFSNWRQLYIDHFWLNTFNVSNRQWKWVGRLISTTPNNLINIDFDFRNQDFTNSNQWYQQVSYGWYRAGNYIIVWIESAKSGADDYDFIIKNTYYRFIYQ